MTQDPSASEQEYHVSGNTLWPVRKVNGRCELVCFNLIRGGVPADLPVSGLRAGVETWAFKECRDFDYRWY